LGRASELGGDYLTRFSKALLEVLFGQKASFASSISHENATLLGGLYVRLVVASNAVTNSNKAEFLLFKKVAMFGRQLKQSVGQPIVVLLLLYRVVQGGVT
jgi:hypothetical protein